MPANRIQLQNALHKPYDRVLFAREVLSPVFGSGFTLNSALVSALVSPNKSESAAIDKVWIYGNIQLDDSTEITCYEVLLQPKVRIEQSKVAIQQYVRKLLTAGQAALINFVAPANKNVWRLTLVAKDSVLTDKGVKEKTTNAKRYTFLLGPSETCKTAAERFEVLSTEKEITFQTLVNAFSVEKLSKEFFDEYTLHYQNFCDYLQQSNYCKSVFNITFPAGATKVEKDKASKPIRDFVKKLLGRMVFLYFVQKKGWLGASDTNYTDGLVDFIKQLFHKSGGNDTFYSNWLTVLFFDTLNKERTNDDFTMPDGKTVKVPFLNGGLFDKEEFDEHLLTFPAKLFHHPDFEDTILTEKSKGNARGFLDFLDAFNFTIYEDSPDDHTVAVDPEILGHIFENLLEDNKDKGAFYTPKEIVHYMCQESLTEYLKNSPPLEGWSKTGVVRNSQNYFNLPYNPKLKDKARELRKAGNLAEVLFWNRVKNKQFKGFDFDRQKIIGNYIVDFFCTNCNTVIEIDGSSHDDKFEYDAERDAFLQSLGLYIIHIPAKDVLQNLDEVMQMLFDHPALKGTPPVEGNWGEKVQGLLKLKEANELSKEELHHIENLLDQVKICDPAIGSGAFPMGLLQEIFSIKELIAYETGKPWNPAETKLNIIQNSIYGVDIEKGAVDIARLRFWLSLVVDEEKPKALPNLDYKIVVGDSIISKFDGEIVEIDWEIKGDTQTEAFGNENLNKRLLLLKEISEKQKKYFNPANKNKKALAFEIRNIKIDILINQLEMMVKTEGIENSFLKNDFKNKTKYAKAMELYTKTQNWLKTIDKLKKLKQNPDEPFNHFDWKLDFPEVLNSYLVPDENQRGFDIVIANPPYIKEYTNRAAFDGFRTSPYYKGKMDIWYGFACKMLDLLKPEGIECFIAQNNWITSAGASIFRNKVLSESEIKLFSDFGNYKVFETAGIQTMIYILQKGKPRKEYDCKFSVLKNDKINKVQLIDFLNFEKSDKNSEKFIFKLQPQTLIGKPFTFNNNIASDVLSKIGSKGNLFLTEKEVAQGIVFPQDFVNKKSKEKLRNTVEVGDGIFVLTMSELRNLSLESSEKEIIKPYYTTEELHRYYANPKNKLWIIYTGSEFKNPELMKPYTNLKKHLDLFKDVITSDNKPYGLHRAREERFFKGESIIALRKCPNRPSFTYKDFDCYVSATFYVIKTSRLNMKYLTGLLNSKLIEFWLRNKGKMQGNNFQIDKEPLMAIPLLKPNGEIEKTIEKLVLKIIDNKAEDKKTDSFEQQIDNLIYRLYELTYDEVLVIDPAFPLSKEEYESIKLE